MTVERASARPGAAQPVFVLGTARSGTSWCANLLATHPAIAAVATAAHEGITGIHESHLFSHTRYHFPESMTAAQFIARYKEEDYFKLTGLSPEAFQAAHPGHFTIYQLFRALMDDMANRKRASHWLEKTPKHTIYFDELIERFPDALIVVTRRNFRDTVQSNLRKYPRKGVPLWRQAAEKVFRYVSDRRAIRRLKRGCRGRIIEVSYDALLADTQAEVARLLRFLGVETRELTSSFPSNSAYPSGQKPGQAFGPLAWAACSLLRWACWLIPFPLVRHFRRQRDRQRANRFPKYTFVPTPKEWSEA